MTMHPPFVPPSATDSRSPCPALNALANHSYIPHDGRDISFFTLVKAIKAVYKMSTPVACLLAIAGVILCGFGFKVNLHDLALHNRIEHDASLVHDNTLRGHRYAPCLVNPSLVARLISYSSDGKYITQDDLARYRFERNTSLAKPLDPIHNIVTFGEFAFTLQTLQNDEGKIPIERIEAWFGEERLPEGWERPVHDITFGTTQPIIAALKATLAKLKGAPQTQAAAVSKEN